jgi:hypothetical protein
MIHGTEMPPCNHCMQKELKCFKHPILYYYSECKCANYRCFSLSSSAQEWDNLEKETKRIQSDHAKALTDAQEALVYILHLDKQQELLKTHSGEMFFCGLCSLNELEALNSCIENKANPGPLSLS